MAKGQQRSTKEQRKPKSSDKPGDKKQSGPKYLRQPELAQSTKPGVPRAGPKK